MGERFTLITGRTKEQGQARHLGKDSCAYQDATSWLEMNADDMARLGIAEGEWVRVQSEAGQPPRGTLPEKGVRARSAYRADAERLVDLPVRTGALPEGLVFVPSGPAANRLGSADTEGTGMPLLKGLTVVIASRPAGQIMQPAVESP